MQIFKNKKVLLALSILAVVPFLVACSLFGPKDLEGDTEAQKTFMQEAETKFSEQESIKIEGSGKSSGQDMGLVIVLDGEDMSMDIDSEQMDMRMVLVGDYSYIGNGEKWVKMKNEDAEDVTSSLTKMKEEFGEELLDVEDSDWEDENIKYEGMEEVDGVSTYKFKNTDENGDTSYVWFDAKNKLPIKVESSEGDDDFTVTFSYDDVSVEEPTDYEDLTDMDEGERMEKIMEIFS